MSPILQTLKRKGLGLEASELELEEVVDPAGKVRRFSEGLDLTLARPKLCVSESFLVRVEERAGRAHVPYPR